MICDGEIVKPSRLKKASFVAVSGAFGREREYYNLIRFPKPLPLWVLLQLAP